MKRVFSRILSLCLGLLLLAAVPCAQAAELNSFLNFYEIVDTDLLVYGDELPEDGSLTVSIDSQLLSDAVLSTVRQEELPVTVYCLVDISTHLSKQQVQQREDILNIISSRMGEKDTMVITSVGSKVIEGAVLTGSDARTTAISTLGSEGYKADMYQAVVTAMTSLAQKTTYHANRCLLILSDGLLSNGSTTRQQALDAIAATDIPVYAVATTGETTDYSVRNASNILGMAEASQNGVGIDLGAEKMYAAAGGQQIWERIQEGSVIKIDLNTVTATGNNAVLRAQYLLGDTRLEDTITLDLTMVEKPTESTEETGETLTTEETLAAEETLAVEPIPEPEGNNNLLLIGCVAGGVVLIAVVLAFLLKKKGKQPEPVAENPPSVEAIPSTGDLDDQKKVEDYSKTAPAKSHGDVTIRLVVESHKNVSTSFPLQTNCARVLGRDDRADIILNAEDQQLSGRHCLVEWDGSYLYIQDMGSTNGTLLNGTPLKPDSWSRVNNNSTLSMGSFTYQVVIGG